MALIESPGASLPGRKVMSLVHGMLAGADSIDDMNVLRAGWTDLILGHRVMAPSTLGTFLRAFTFGHVRQLDRVLDVALARAWQAGAGPGEGPLVMDLDSFVGEVHGYEKQGAGYGYTRTYGYHPIIATRADTGEVIHIRCRKGQVNTQRGAGGSSTATRPRAPRRSPGPNRDPRGLGVREPQAHEAIGPRGRGVLDRRQAEKQVRALIAGSPNRTGSRSTTTRTPARRRSPKPSLATGG